MAKLYWDKIGMQYESENEEIRDLSKKFGTHFGESDNQIQNRN